MLLRNRARSLRRIWPGLTVDLQRRGMTKAQVKWMEDYMRPLKELGLIEPEEERRQWCFHIMVSGDYSIWRLE